MLLQNWGFYFLFLFFLFMGGCVIGSFLNVCIFRIPKKETIVYGHSHCMTCNNQIKWYDLIPVLSFIVLGGKCRHCKEKISMRYPMVEMLTGVTFALSGFFFGFSLKALVYCLFFSGLIVASFIDIDTGEIPNGISIYMLALGALATIVLRDMPWYEHLIGLVAVSGVLLIIALISNGMGGGDIKLMAGCGLLMGWQLSLLSLLVACLLGSVIGLIIMLVKKSGSKIPFSPYLSGAMLFCAFFGRDIIAIYLNFVDKLMA